MFNKTAKNTSIALGLAMVASTGIAAQNSAGMNDANAMDGAMSGSNASSDRALMTQFKALDTNDDNVISRSEAAQSPQLAQMYDSFDTSATIEGNAKDSGRSGLTFDQFQAGMQAESSRSGGVVGPSVSGGETYTIMNDGSRKMDDASSDTRQPMNDSMEPDTGQPMGETMDGGMQDKASDSMSSMPDKSGSMSEDGMDQGTDNADAMRDEMKAQGSDDYGKTDTMENSGNAPLNSSGSADPATDMDGQMEGPDTDGAESNY